MPRPATVEETRRAEFFEADQQVTNASKPIIPATVVYLGSNPKMSVSLKGRVFVEKYEIAPGETREVKTISDESGMTAYPFWLRDLTGRIIAETTMPMTEDTPAEYRGRPFAVCEHPDHLVYFHTKRDDMKQPEFRVLFTNRGAKANFDEYAARALGRKRRAEQEFAETVR